MADVFISCARVDHARVRQIAERLASLGFSVCWEKNTSANSETETEIDVARAVIVAWSGEARHSTWICGAASRALDTNRLLQIRLDGSPPPPPFDSMPTFDMSSDRAEWGPLEAKVATLVHERTGAQGKPPWAGPLATANTAGAPRLITFALVTSLIAYAGALTEARNGVMTPDQLQLALTGVIGVAATSAALCVHRLVLLARAGG